MTDEIDANDGFATLIRKTPDAGVAEPRGGAGIAQTKSDQQVSGYRDLVRRQLEKRKTVKSQNNDTIPSPTRSSSEIVSNTELKTSIEDYDLQVDLKSSVEQNVLSIHLNNGSKYSIEEIQPDFNTSIENIDPQSPFSAGSFSSIEINTPPSLFHSDEISKSVFKLSDNDASVTPYLSPDRSTENVSERNFDTPNLSSAIFPIENNTTLNIHGLKSSIEKSNPHDGLNVSIEESEPTEQIYNAPPLSIETKEPGSLISIESIAPTNTEESSSDDSSFHSIEFFEPFIPLADRRNYAFKLNGNYTKLPHSIVKHAGKLDAKTFNLYLYLYRQSYGWGKNKTQIPLSQYFLSNALDYSKNTVVKCLQRLLQLNLIQQLETVPGTGTVYQVNYFSYQGEVINDLPDKNYLALDNNFFELKTITTTARIVYLYLYKESYGFNQNYTNRLLTSEIAKTFNLTTRTIQEGIRELLNKKIIKRTEEIFSSNGIIYRVLLAQEICQVKNKTPLEFKCEDTFTKTTITRSNTSIEKFGGGSTTSIEGDGGKSSFRSIENFESNTIFEAQEIEITNDSAITSNSSIERNDSKENNKNLNKTSSELADDVLKFFAEQTSKIPNFKFTISRNKISDLLKEQHTSNYLKSSFAKLLPVMLRESVTNPVGIYLHALKNPDAFFVMQKPSTEEMADRKRYENQVELHEKSFTDEFKRILESKQDNFWAELDEHVREEAIAKRRVELRAGQGGELKIPDVAIKRSAIERTFWDRHRELWQSLTESERATRTNTVKQKIIMRVYAGEGRALPEPLPERDFLKSVDEFAEKLAMISTGKGSNT